MIDRPCAPPPVTAVQPVTEVLHGVAITDPYRWLEDQNSSRTREWICLQNLHARTYLDNIPGREHVRKRVACFLAREAQDSVQEAGGRYFFRKRHRHQEQASIYTREALEGPDQLLVDPYAGSQSIHTAVKILRVSADGNLLLYETKEGGERTGTFAIVDVRSRRTLPDILPRGYLRGFAFAPDGKSFVYIHEVAGSAKPCHPGARRHVLGTSFCEDQEVFSAGAEIHGRIALVADRIRMGFIVYSFQPERRISFYLRPFETSAPAQRVLANASFSFVPFLANDRLFALTNRDAPNFRVVELSGKPDEGREWIDVITETDRRIHQCLVFQERFLVSYIRGTSTRVVLFDFQGKQIREIASSHVKTIRLAGGSRASNEAFLETESFAEPKAVTRLSVLSGERSPWCKAEIPIDSADFAHTQVWFRSKDGTRVPMYLAGLRSILAEGRHPTILTAYGGYGVPMTPQFSVFVAFLMERGCLFALPQIRGGSEFGSAWHEAAKRRKRQTAYDDFLSAANWLLDTGRTPSDRLAIFGGSNSGLLVGAAATQRPDLFRAVVCLAPMLDMIRYHLFDDAHVWRDEFGTADDPKDFEALRAYSPYHTVRDRVSYPAFLIVSGDADGTCNPLHARKMTARLQRASCSGRPILLDYSPFRGHSPVLPLSERIQALTDRLAFLCDQLGLGV